MRHQALAILMLATITGCSDTTSAPSPAESSALQSSADRLEADVRFLADDLLEGREAGTRGYDIATLFVAERFRTLGLKPGGEAGTYLQPVPLLEYEAGDSASLTIESLDLVEGEDYIAYPSAKGTSIDITAPLVFGGMCFESEREGRNDFADLDLKGKIVACISGAPKYLNSEELAHYRSTQGKRLSDRGAIGNIGIYTRSREARFPFERLTKMMRSGRSRMTWVDDDGVPFTLSPNLQAGAILSLAGAEKLFAASGQAWEDILDDAESESGDVTRFEMGLDSRIRTESRHRLLTSNNVVGILPGTDAELSKEYVVLTAHLDHLGVKPTDEDGDDEIYNGAMDNATGTSALLEVARLLQTSPPKRSVIFIALTAEEKGLTGSSYYASNPTVPAKSLVAVVNLDMPIMSYDFTDIIAFGAERSTMYGPVEQAAKTHGLVLSPDPVPEEGLFTRSDHYSFVKQGIPAVFLKPGFANGGEALQEEFRKEHYHQPSDEIGLIDFNALRRFTDVKADIARNVADMPERPVWNAGDFFGTTFGGPIANE